MRKSSAGTVQQAQSPASKKSGMEVCTSHKSSRQYFKNIPKKGKEMDKYKLLTEDAGLFELKQVRESMNTIKKISISNKNEILKTYQEAIDEFLSKKSLQELTLAWIVAEAVGGGKRLSFTDEEVLFELRKKIPNAMTAKTVLKRIATRWKNTKKSSLSRENLERDLLLEFKAITDEPLEEILKKTITNLDNRFESLLEKKETHVGIVISSYVQKDDITMDVLKAFSGKDSGEGVIFAPEVVFSWLSTRQGLKVHHGGKAQKDALEVYEVAFSLLKEARGHGPFASFLAALEAARALTV